MARKLRKMEAEAVERRRVWANIYSNVQAACRLFNSDPDSSGLNAFLQAMRNYLARYIRAMDEEQPVVWFNLGWNPEFLYAMDLQGVCVQQMAVFHNIAQNNEKCNELIDLAEAHGVPSDLCSADKASTGAMTRKLYPPPACHVNVNTPCDSQVVAAQVAQELAPAEQYFIDIPYYHDDRTVSYVAKQLEGLIPFLTRNTGRTFDWDRLRHACELSNKTMENLWEWNEWRKHVPVVQASKVCALNLVIHILFDGSEDGVRFSRGLLDEAKLKATRGDRPIEERVRAIWYQDPVWWDIHMYDWMERELGLTIPMDVFGFYSNEGYIDTSSPEKMLWGLANKLIRCMPMARQFRGDADFYIRDFNRLVEDYQADCGIYAGHIGCKHGWGAIGLLREACRKSGLPLLVFEFDMFDPRIMGKEEIKMELARFVNEIVWPRKQAASA